MTNRLQEMTEILGKQSLIYESLLHLAEKKQQVLIKGDMDELDKITQQEQILILQAGKLEEGRFRLQQELAGHFSLPAKELTLTRLMELSPGEETEALRGQCNRLGEVFKGLHDLNQQNTQLIEQSLQFINFTVDLMTRGEETPVYDEKGKSAEGRKAGAGNLFDRRV